MDSSSSESSLTNQYLNSLTEMERIAYNIAKSHLGSLFSLEKSNDYLDWLKKTQYKIKT
jgi:hypothetical protein